MSRTRNTLIAASIVAAAGAIVALTAAPSIERPDVDSARRDAVPADSPARSAQPRPRTTAKEATTAAPAETAPSPVDLAAVDRDLDLHGVVVRKDGTPVAGASLVVVSAPWSRAMLLNFVARDLELLGPSTKSAQDGSFRLRLERGRDVTLRVAADGLAPVDLPHRLAGERVRVVLEQGVRLVFKAVDEAGVGLSGVPIRVFRHELQGDPVFRHDGTTAESGSCTFDGLPPACQVYLETRAAGRAPVSFQKFDLPTSGEAAAEVKLSAGRTLRGRVVDATTGGAVADARVGMGWTLTASVKTSGDGTFVLPGWVDKDESEVHVLAAGHARAQATVGSRDFLEFSLERGFETVGRIVDAAGAPVGGALVSVVASVREDRRQRTSMGDATSDAAGRFRAVDLDRALPHRIIVVATGHARIVRRVEAPPADGPLDLGDVALPPSRSIEGRVVSSTGEPIARMPLELWGPDDRDYFHYGYNEDRATDDLGRFRFPDLSPGTYQLSTKQRGSSEVVQQVELAADADRRDVVITVDAGTTITATVVDEEDKPVSGVYVMAFGGGGMSPGAESDANGVAKIVVRGTGLKMRAACSLADPRCLVAPPMHDLGAEEREVRFVMKRGAKIAGVVLDPDGKPVANAVVDVRPANPSVGISPADAEGRFSAVVETGRSYSVVFDGMTQGDRMRPTNFAARLDDVAAGSTDLVLRSERVALDRTLTVKCVMPDGSSPQGIRVFIMSSSQSFPAAGAMTAEGRVSFAALPAKELSVMAWPTGDWLGPKALSVTPTGQEVVLTMRRALPITGTVVGKDDKPIKGAYARAYTGTTMHQGNDTKEDGAFRLLVPADDPGPFRVEVQFQVGTKSVRAIAENVVPSQAPIRVVLDTK